MMNETIDISKQWSEKINFEFVSPPFPTTLIVKFDQNDYSCGTGLLSMIKHLSRYMTISYHEGIEHNSYIIQFDYDVYHNENLNKLFDCLHSFLYSLESRRTA